MSIPGKMKFIFRVLTRDALFASLLAGFACFQAGMLLRDWTGPAGSLTNELYIPAICFAQGRGFINISVDEAPGLRAFLDFQSPALDPDACASAKSCEWTAYQRYHRYLNYYIGIFWRFFGISWDAMKIPIVFAFVVFILLNYAIFRLAINPWLAFCLTYLLLDSKAIYIALPVFRDFAKGPFFLVVIFLLGWLLRHPRKTKSILWIAVGLGLAAGIGIGFRRDLAIGLPISFFILLCCRCDSPRPVIARRLMACALCVALFLLSAWPILVSFNEEGSLGAHDTIMGFDPRCESEMSLYKSSYERMTFGNDLYIGAVVSGFEQIDRGVFGSDVINAYSDKEGYLKAVAMALPADMLSRVYASILTILKGGCRSVVDNLKCGGFFTLLGPALAMLALSLIAARDLRTVFLVLILLFYFCGYTTLQMHPRHTFHLYFIPFWLLGFSIQHGISAYGAVRARTFGRLLPLNWTRRVFVFCAVSAAWILLPLGAARLWQARTMDTYWERWSTCPSISVPFQRRSLPSWTLFDFRDTSVIRPCAPPQDSWNFFTEYYAADFTANGEDLSFWLKYEAESPANDFSHMLCFPTRHMRPGSKIRCFFPVFNQNFSKSYVRFVGIAVPSEKESGFTGISRSDARWFPLLLSAAVPEDRSTFIDRQKICLWGLPETSNWPELFIRPIWYEEQRNACYSSNLKLLEDAVVLDPPNLMLAEQRALLEESEGRFNEAVSIRMDAVRNNPASPIAYWRFDELQKSRVEPKRRAELWQLLSDDSACACANYYLGLAQRDMGDKKAALASLGAAWTESQSDPDIGMALTLLMIDQSLFDEAEKVRASAMIRGSEMLPLNLAQARILAGQGQREAAISAAQAAILHFPEAFETYAGLDDILGSATPEERLSVWREVADHLPGSPFAAMRLGNAFMAQNNFAAAVELFSKACELNPNDPAAHASRGEALLKSGRTNEALGALREAARINPDGDYLQILIATAQLKLGQRAAAIETARRLQERGGVLPEGFMDWLENARSDGNLP